jgi:hypothetical protein
MSITYIRYGWKLDLKPYELLVYLAIADDVDDDEEGCCASYTRLAEKTNLGRSTVIRAVSKLERAGIIVHLGTHAQHCANIWNIDKDRVLMLAEFKKNGDRRSAFRGRGTASTSRMMRTYVALAARDGLRCRIPGCRNEDLQIDHIIPRARRGSDDLSNLQLLCARHNKAKNTRAWNDFLQNRWDRFRCEYVMMQGVLHEWNALGFSMEDLT